MDLTHYLARLLGIYLIIIGVFYLLRPLRVKEAAKEIMKSSALRLVLAAFGTIAGLAILLAHPVFTPDIGGLVTLLGLLIAIRGIAELFFPEYIAKFNKSILEEPRFKIMSVVVLALGVILTLLSWIRY